MPPDSQVDQTPRPVLSRWVVAFGEFWWDFLVGDTPELVPGVFVVLGGAALAVHQGAPRVVVIAAIPVLACLLLCASVLLRRKTHSH
jgi:hypothetical protein